MSYQTKTRRFSIKGNMRRIFQNGGYAAFDSGARQAQTHKM